MITRGNTLKTIVAAGALIALASTIAKAAGSAPLTWKAFTTDETGFQRAPVLVTGPTEAVLIDAGFTYSDGQTVVEAIRASGKKLTTVFISASDPDYYFNLPVIRQAFPNVPILAAPATVELMRKKAAGKISIWASKLGANGPAYVGDLVFPEPVPIDRLPIDGHEIEIVEMPGTNDRARYLWVPSLKAVFGGVLVYGGKYPWVADSPTFAERQAWIAALDSIIARGPAVVVPGHMLPDWPTDIGDVTQTRDFLIAFNEENARTATADDLIAAMTKRFPSDATPFSLQLGAKVVKGETKWD